MRVIPLSTDEARRIGELSDEISREILRLDHPLQRHAKNWNSSKKGNFIRRILQNGRFLPLQVCTQAGVNGCVVRYLIDGKQRLTTIQSYVQNEFAIPKKGILDYEVTYDGILYEVKEGASKFTLKKNKGKLIPILDEEGKTQRAEQTIDIRGLKFSDLPPELQEQIEKYMIPIQVRHNCTDEDIQLEIIDYNSGAPMNAAQIGKSYLGVKLADEITKLAQHDIIMAKCGFSATNEIKGLVERSVGESLALIALGVDYWKSDYKELCSDMAKSISREDVDRIKDLYDKFDEAVSDTEKLRKHMVNKEFFIVMANFAYFVDKGYPLNCYDKFIQQFVSEKKYEKIIRTDDIDENGDDIYDSYISIYETGTKRIDIIENRLNQMNKWLDEYLEQECSSMECQQNAETNEQALQNFVEDCGLTENEALCCLMELDNRCGYIDDFADENVKKYKEFFLNNFDHVLIENCTKIYNEIIAMPLADDTLIDTYNLPIVIKLRNKYSDTPSMEEMFSGWLKDFANAEDCAFVEIGDKTFEEWTEEEVDQTTNATITSKYAILQESFEKYKRKK